MALINYMPFVCLAMFVLLGVFSAASKLPHRRKMIISVLFGAIGLGGLFTYLFWLGPLYGPAHTVVDILYYTGPKGDVLLVQDITSIAFRGTSGSYGRLTMIDATTGKVNKKVSTGSNYRDHKNLRLQVLLDDKIWYQSYDNGVHARDPYTGEIVTDITKLTAPYPQLNYRKESKVTTPEGYVFSRRPPDFEFRIDSFPGNTMNGNETFMKYYRDWGLHPYLKRKTWLKMLVRPDTSYTPLFLKDEFAVLDRENGFCLCPIDSEHGDQATMQFWHTNTTSEGDYKMDTLINPKLKLKSGAIIENYLLHNPASLLIHYETIDSTFKKGFRVSRMDLKGKIIWEVSDEEMGGVPGFPYDSYDKTSPYTYNRGILYLVAGTQVVALDTKTGKKKWSTNLGR
jgi:hypothetical protein